MQATLAMQSLLAENNSDVARCLCEYANTRESRKADLMQHSKKKHVLADRTERLLPNGSLQLTTKMAIAIKNTARPGQTTGMPTEPYLQTGHGTLQNRLSKLSNTGLHPSNACAESRCCTSIACTYGRLCCKRTAVEYLGRTSKKVRGPRHSRDTSVVLGAESCHSTPLARG